MITRKVIRMLTRTDMVGFLAALRSARRVNERRFQPNPRFGCTAHQRTVPVSVPAHDPAVRSQRGDGRPATYEPMFLNALQMRCCRPALLFRILDRGAALDVQPPHV